MHTKGTISRVPRNTSIHNQVVSALNIVLPVLLYSMHSMYILSKIKAREPYFTLWAKKSTDMGKLEKNLLKFIKNLSVVNSPIFLEARIKDRFDTYN